MKRYDAMRACPKYDGCNAPICPLDPDRKLRSHGTGDPICFYMLESVKPGSDERFEARTIGGMLPAIRRAIPDICSRWASVRHTVQRAATTGSRMDRQQPKAKLKEVA
jgi:hypothetical protein